jgi:N-acetylneuraminic acid mutarotase
MKATRLSAAVSLLLFGTALPGTAQTSAIAHNTWSNGAAMPLAVGRAAAAVLEGKIYLVGGQTTSGFFITDTQIYDPATNAWSPGAPLPKATSAGCSAVVNDVLYFIGGFLPGSIEVTDAVWAYNPKTATWSSEATKPTAEEGATCVAENNIIYVSGGYNGTFLSTVESYNPATNSWASEASMLLQEDVAVAGLVGTTIIVTDGSDNVYTGYTQGYNPNTNAWTPLNADPTARQGTCGGAIGSLLYSAAGWNGGTENLTVNESFTLSNGNWKTLAPIPVGTQDGGSAVYKGKLYCFGGFLGNGKTVGNLQIYQP